MSKTKNRLNGTAVEWTRYWSSEEIEEMRPKLEKVLIEYPEFSGEKLTVGRTSSARGRRPKDDDIKRSNRYYIQLNPESADMFTISHELQHILTREKAVDVLAMTRSPDLIVRNNGFGYIDLPEKVEENLEYFDQLLHSIAVEVVKDSLDKESESPLAKEFEQRVQKEVEDWDV